MSEFYNRPESPIPVPVINNMPLDEYQKLKDAHDEYKELVIKYEYFIKSVFGRIDFIDDVDLRACKKRVQEDTQANQTTFIFSFKVPNDKASMILKRNEWINNEKETN